MSINRNISFIEPRLQTTTPISQTISSSTSSILNSLIQKSSRRSPYVNRTYTHGEDQSAVRTGYIFAFIVIFLIVLFGIVGRVIYSSSDPPTYVYEKYRRTSSTANRGLNNNNKYENDNQNDTDDTIRLSKSSSSKKKNSKSKSINA